MNCLVTGGAGFIGSHIATSLVEYGHQVRVLDNLSTGHRKNLEHICDRIDFQEGDICDAKAVGNSVADVDLVFHQAALASVPRSVKDPFATNSVCVGGTLNMLSASRKAGVKRFIYAGSSSAYGDQPYASKRESDLPTPLSPYASAKLAGEQYCRAFFTTYGLETVVIRYFNVFGPRQDPNSEYSAVIPRFVKAMIAGQRPIIFGDGLQSRDFTFVDNVVSGNLAAAKVDDAAGRVFNVACGSQTNLLSLVAQINSILGSDISPVFEKPRVGDVRNSLADISLARRVLGYEQTVSFKEGLQRSIAYYVGTTA